MPTAQSKAPVLRVIVDGCSRLLLWIGAAVFFLGGKLLHEVKHIAFFDAEVFCIIVGIVLMMLGGGVAIASESRGR